LKRFLYNDIFVTPSYSVFRPYYDYDTPRSYFSTKINSASAIVSRNNSDEDVSGMFSDEVNSLYEKNHQKVESYELSKGERKRLKYACSMLQLLSKEKTATNWKANKKFNYKLVFITLTLPSLKHSISDKTAKNVYLKNFIKRLRQKYGLTHYVWKAEAQENGNIHFHLTANIYIHYLLLRQEWNSVLKDSGLIEEFHKSNGHRNPNSTDIHSVKNVKNLGSYMVKYLTGKKDNRRKIDGKLWNCSESLKWTKRLCISGNLTGDEISRYLYDHENKNIITTDHCDIYKGNLYRTSSNDIPFIKNLTKDHLSYLNSLVRYNVEVDQEQELFRLLWKKIKPKILRSSRIRMKTKKIVLKSLQH
jgi:hypothetical protein